MALLGQFLNLLKTPYIVRNARFHSGRHARRLVDAPEVKLRHYQSMADDRLCALAYRRGPVLAGTLPRMEYDPKTYITETIRRAGAWQAIYRPLRQCKSLALAPGFKLWRYNLGTS